MILRRTQSLCPVCLRRLDAVYALAQDDPSCVELRKTCPDHGQFSVPVWRTLPSDTTDVAGQPGTNVPGNAPVPAFESWSRPKSPSYPLHPRTAIDQGCPFDCGLCPSHAQHTCTGLVEVTMRCNMTCPICYASAGGTGRETGGDPDLACIASQMDALKTASGPCNVQISGGEPTVREDLPQIIRLARERAFGLVQVNTNGLRLAEEEGYAAKLRQAGLDSVYLQWDGVSEKTFATLRGRPCMDFKRRAVAACAKAGLGVVLVATLVRGVNDGEAGDLLRLALQLGPAVRGLHVQPAAFFGRYPWRLDEAPRLTLPEVMSCFTRQAPEFVRPEHLHPPGCENELCSFSAVYRRTDAARIPNGNAATEKDTQPTLQWLADAGQSCCSPRPQSAGGAVPSVMGATGASGTADQQKISSADSHEASLAAAGLPPSAEEGARKAKQFVALHWRGNGNAAPEEAAGTQGFGAASAEVDGFSRFLSQAGAERRFTLSGMAFQDALSLDLERVRGCCIHVLRRDGRMIPFCLHNLTAQDGTRLYAEDPS